MFCDLDLRLRQEAVFEKVKLVQSFASHSESVSERWWIQGRFCIPGHIREIEISPSRPVADLTTIHYILTMDHFGSLWVTMEGGGQGGGHLQELQLLHSTSIISTKYYEISMPPMEIL